MKTFLQVLEGSDYQHAQVIAIIDAPPVVQAVQRALAQYFARRVSPIVEPPPHPNGGRSRTTYMQKYGKSLKVMAEAAGLLPSVVSTRLRRGLGASSDASTRGAGAWRKAGAWLSPPSLSRSTRAEANSST